MVDKILIHPTTLDKLSKCKLWYAWSREFRPATKSVHLEFGLAIHEALEAHYSGKRPIPAFVKYMKEHSIQVAGLSDEVPLGKSMLTNYVRHYDTDLDDFEIISLEQEVARKIPIPPDDPKPPKIAKRFYVATRMDGLVRDKETGRIYVLEHKTFEKFYANSLENNHQFIIEKFIADGMVKKDGEECHGVIYNGLRKKASSSTVNLFERRYLHINERQVEIMLHRVYWQLRYLHSKQFRVYPEPGGLTCVYCDFKIPCAAYSSGGDYEFLLDTIYDKREESENVWE